MHKLQLADVSESFMSDIDILPIHPKDKLLLYQRNWTVADLSKIWVCENLDNIVSRCIRQWLELPVSATFSNIFLSRRKFGLNIQQNSHSVKQFYETHLNLPQAKK